MIASHCFFALQVYSKDKKLYRESLNSEVVVIRRNVWFGNNVAAWSAADIGNYSIASTGGDRSFMEK